MFTTHPFCINYQESSFTRVILNLVDILTEPAKERKEHDSHLIIHVPKGQEISHIFGKIRKTVIFLSQKILQRIYISYFLRSRGNRKIREILAPSRKNWDEIFCLSWTWLLDSLKLISAVLTYWDFCHAEEIAPSSFLLVFEQQK